MKTKIIFLVNTIFFKSFLFAINIFLIFIKINRKKSLKICLCTIGKKENLYASEFVDHYKKIGYDKIFIYDNNDIEDEKFEDVLNRQISTNYEWLSFFDFDEFLELNKNRNIKEYLNNKKFKKCANIKINWLEFSDNDLIYYKNDSLQKRFTKPLYQDKGNIFIKSTVRGNLKFNYWRSMNNPHSSSNYLRACNSQGSIIDPTAFYNSPYSHEYSYLKHYSTKTIEEYCNKIKKGRADLSVKLDTETLKNYFYNFFDRNKNTKEKIDYIRKYYIRQ